jgi:hypothetical protein
MARNRRAITRKWLKNLTCLAAMLALGGITDSGNIAPELGTVIRSEEACGLGTSRNASEDQSAHCAVARNYTIIVRA